ncbi:uncharacterized protein UV8b_06106 [Ustilaginoidea virens]|uniref:Rhodopsin domain-containing protein n=1 Tax=Ustilaginoidea virens TaxID=1159556 RepID=A0A8E5HUH8_USTVR|nr:uncharacterized protein UV8b_06106 [Ustilaginoidea virens]QUC21865.1 hypothetical protein UV8b_06106 [Ustilaginoidea virens]
MSLDLLPSLASTPVLSSVVDNVCGSTLRRWSRKPPMSTKAAAPPGDVADRGHGALVLFWTTAAAGTVIVGLRFLGRKMRRRTGLDDWIMLLTLVRLAPSPVPRPSVPRSPPPNPRLIDPPWLVQVLYIVWVALLSKVISCGGLAHAARLSAAQMARAAQWSWMSQPFVVMGFATGKASVGVLLWRVVGSTTFWRKWVTVFAVASAFALSVVDVVLTFAQCSPVEALWKQELLAGETARCWDPSIQTNFALGLSAWNILTDLYLAVLPATFLYRLNLTFRKKLGLCALLGLGATAAVFAAVKTSYLYQLSARSDITWETYNLYVWSGLELFVIIVCGSLPPIKPVCDWMLGRPVSAAVARYASKQSASSPSRPTMDADRVRAADADVELHPRPGRGHDVSPHSTTYSLLPEQQHGYSPP